jgi:hypothetical protein
MTAPNMNNVARAVDRIRALRRLESITGTRTTRSQNDLLQSLNSADLAEVALQLSGDDHDMPNRK